MAALSPPSIPAGSLHIAVHGIVQGVGFRPFVYRLAHRCGLTGTVANDGDGVVIHIDGTAQALDAFVVALRAEVPAVARIVSMEVRPAHSACPATDFRILPSLLDGRPSTQIAPDIAVCPDCLDEILDPANRRYRYPFTNCTNCGPRFSIIERVPYDRPNTSMRRFTMCEACSHEYHDPLDRRFHAQPNACPECGPRLSWHDAWGRNLAGDGLPQAARALAEGSVVAIKGLGGFHLAVDGSSEEAVAILRQRKNRPAKPLAIMVADLQTARRYCLLSDAEAALLTSPEHPIVLSTAREGVGLARGIAPGLGHLGLMLPYTPLHHLLFAEPATPGVLVMTSGNRSDEPICTGNDEALARLRGLADFFLLHDRDIVTRVDDSVTRIMDDQPRLLRRARGYAPVPVQLRQPTGDILACGAEMKNSFCLVRNNEAYVSQHIGELTGGEQFDFYLESIEHLHQVLDVRPQRIASDRHPDYLSTRYAQGRAAEWQAIQHHHAHIGAVMAEQGLEGPVLGIVLDGTGYGGDGTVFGGEIYRADRAGFSRLARLSHLRLPGGDRAAEQPWRMALSLLYQGLGEEAFLERVQPRSLAAIAGDKKALIGQLLRKGVHSPLTSSCGRLFDAVSALVGLCLTSDYEGQAAMLLEYQAGLVTDRQAAPFYPPVFCEEEGVLVLDSALLAGLICRDLTAGLSVPVIARRFHGWLVDGLESMLHRLRQRTGVEEVVLAGGCMQNKLLFETLAARLRVTGFSVHAGGLIPMHDGGISLGQAYIGGNVCV